MRFYQLWTSYFLRIILFAFSSLSADEKALPEEMLKIMHQKKYDYSTWGIYVKDMETGKVLLDLNSDKLFLPASTTKLFSTAALLNAFGDDYHFKTPIFAAGNVANGVLQGNLILVAQGDLIMGGRGLGADKIAFTKLDHIIANEVPGVILTKQDPLHGINELAKQVYQSGIKAIHGDVLIDDRLFETTHKRGMVLSPIMINENLIDIVINPSLVGQMAHLTWRPAVPGYTIENQVKTVAAEEAFAIEASSNDLGHHILVHGTIPIDQHNIVRIFPIEEPASFARAAFIHALQNQGIKIHLPKERSSLPPSLNSYANLRQVALWTSPPLSEYVKLILKVSHNLGANLVPLLLASRQGKKTFEEGMRLLGDFVTQEVKLSPNTFVFVDAAGGDENRLTPQAEVKLLEFIYKQPLVRFKHFFKALPVLGVDGSLEDFAKETSAVGRVRAKPGTGVAFNLATGTYFLTTQAMAGYIEGKNSQLFAYMLVVNNGEMPSIDDIFSIFEDEGQLSSMIYNSSE